MRRLLVLAAGVAATVAACGGDDPAGTAAETPRTSPPTADTRPDRPVVDSRPEVEPYRPSPAEKYPNAKRLAARVARRAVTYGRGATPRGVAASLGPSAVGRDALARVIERLVEPGMRSAGEVVYPQLSGVTETSLGAMVAIRQTLEDQEGARRSVTRVLDVRLRRSGGPWSLDRIAAVGGSPKQRPPSLPKAAERVLDSPNITLTDSARWDIYRRRIDTALLDALADAARQRELSIAVLRSGHPRNVWATGRRSAHSAGLAADIYAVDGQPVVSQREQGSPAYTLARDLFAGGARQIGSPWLLGAGRPRSFTDAVHEDHIHVQQSPAG